MNDKQQLAAMGEHMREMEECKQKKHSYAQVMTWAGDYEKIGGHGLIVEMLKSYAGMLGSSKRKPEFKVPDGWKLVPIEPTDEMYYDGQQAGSTAYADPDGIAIAYLWEAMLAATPEYKP